MKFNYLLFQFWWYKCWFSHPGAIGFSDSKRNYSKYTQSEHLPLRKKMRKRWTSSTRAEDTWLATQNCGGGGGGGDRDLCKKCHTYTFSCPCFKHPSFYLKRWKWKENWILVVQGREAFCGTFDNMFTIWYENHTLLKHQENILKKVPIRWIFLHSFIGTTGK
jgi:hypothetical protein